MQGGGQRRESDEEADKLLARRPEISVVIPSYDRYEFVRNAVLSVARQTYTNIEIIVVDDGSTDPRYRLLREIQFLKTDEHNRSAAANVTLLQQARNSKDVFGFANLNHVRNVGINASRGEYIALLDDDDVWLPDKLLLQLEHMGRVGTAMSSTDGFVGTGVFDESQISYETKAMMGPSARFYTMHLMDTYDEVKNLFLQKDLFETFFAGNEFPDVWTLDFVRVCNSIVTSSVIFERRLLDTVGSLPEVRPPGEDHAAWLSLLRATDSVLVRTPSFYYDRAHGHGQRYDFKPWWWGEGSSPRGSI